jgi:hypothetical protein
MMAQNGGRVLRSVNVRDVTRIAPNLPISWIHLDKLAFIALIEARTEQRPSDEVAEGFATFLKKRAPCWASEKQ